jgi:transposase
VKINKKQMEEAIEMQENGKSIQQIAYKFAVHEQTMLRYLRNYQRYGVSLFSVYPTDVTENASS